MALCNKDGMCWATNAYFEQCFDCSTDTITQAINSLQKAKFIYSKIYADKGNKRFISINHQMLSENSRIGIQKNQDRGIRKNQEYNIYNNNIKINKNINIKDFKNKTQIPINMELSESLKKYAIDLGVLDPEFEFKSFYQYHLIKKSEFSDWNQAFMKWIDIKLKYNKSTAKEWAEKRKAKK